jgi:hypothetical protein
MPEESRAPRSRSPQSRPDGSARARSGARRGLPEARGGGMPRWLLPLLAAAGVIAILISVYFQPEERPEHEIVPLYIQVLGTKDIEIPKVNVTFHPAKDPDKTAHSAITDENGVAVLPKDKATGDFFVVARGMDGTIGMGQVREGDRSLAHLELLPAEHVHGEVVTFEGEPLKDAEVQVRFRLPNSPVLAETKTDANGEFSFDKLSSGMTALLFRARAEGYAWQSLEWSRKSADVPSIRLPRTVPLQVKLLDIQGKPVSGVRATLPNHQDRSSTSDVNGVVEFAGLVAKQPVLVRFESGERTYMFRGDLEPKHKPHELVLEAPATLEGIVVTGANRPIAGAKVRHRHGPRAWVVATTASDGRFRIGDLPSGKPWLEYELPTGKIGRFEVELARGQERKGYILRVQPD